MDLLPATYSLPSSHFPAHALEAMLPCISHKPFTSLTSTVQTGEIRRNRRNTSSKSLLQCTIPIQFLSNSKKLNWTALPKHDFYPPWIHPLKYALRLHLDRSREAIQDSEASRVNDSYDTLWFWDVLKNPWWKTMVYHIPSTMFYLILSDILSVCFENNNNQACSSHSWYEKRHARLILGLSKFRSISRPILAGLPFTSKSRCRWHYDTAR